jgi:hypothetical protein
MKLELKRFSQDAKATLGDLFVDGKWECYSLERPWLNNEKQLSCIPPGTYKIGLHDSPHFKRTLPHLLDVPSRDYILIHPANWPSELKGCIAPGQVKGDDCVYKSKTAFEALNAKIVAALAADDEVIITVS